MRRLGREKSPPTNDMGDMPSGWGDHDSGGGSEMLLEQLRRALDAGFRQDHGLGFADGIINKPRLMQPSHGGPIMSFPGPVISWSENDVRNIKASVISSTLVLS